MYYRVLPASSSQRRVSLRSVFPRLSKGTSGWDSASAVCVPFAAAHGVPVFFVGPQLGPKSSGLPLTWLRSNLQLLMRLGELLEDFNTLRRSQRDCSPFYRGRKFDKRWERKNNEEANHRYAPRRERHDTDSSTGTGTQ